MGTADTRRLRRGDGKLLGGNNGGRRDRSRRTRPQMEDPRIFPNRNKSRVKRRRTLRQARVLRDKPPKNLGVWLQDKAHLVRVLRRYSLTVRDPFFLWVELKRGKAVELPGLAVKGDSCGFCLFHRQ